MSTHTQAESKPPRPPAPGKRWIQVQKVANGLESTEWIEVDLAADGPSWGERAKLRLLNHDLRRVDGPEKVTGRAQFPHDVRLPGMVWARLLLSPYPLAKFELNLTAARAVPGVVDARALREDGQSNFLGQAVAVVSAQTPEAAEDGLRALAARWVPGPFAVTREQALADDAPKVNRDGNVGRERTQGNKEEVEAALAACHRVVSARYTLPVQHHASLETHGVVVDYRGGDSATIHASTQGTFTIAGEAAEILGLAAGKVQVEVPYMGGGFGAKFGLDVPGTIACRVAKDLARPVHLFLTRRDEFLLAGNRSGCVQQIKLGADESGKLLAISAEVDRLGGRGDGSFAALPYVYSVAKRHLRLRSVFTHTDASRAFRAPGHPQASFGMESSLDELAYALGQDPLELRLANLPERGGADWRRQLERCAREIGWYEHENRTSPGKGPGPLLVGIGFGVAVWGGGGGKECEVEVRIGRDGSLTALSGTQDLGTGTRTYLAAIVAEEFFRPLEAVATQIGSTRLGRANASGGSTTAASLAPAVKSASHNAKREFLGLLAASAGLDPSALELGAEGVVGRAADGTERRWSWLEACAQLGPNGLSAKGEWVADLAGNGVHGAQAAKVQVDVRTGELRVLHMVGVQDCGLPLNRKAVQSQIQGGMIQALSYALFEQRVIDPDLGLALNANLEDYKLAGTLEMPAFASLIDDGDVRQQVIGMAEPAVIPGHAAIANAVHNACGVRVRELPLTPDKILAGWAALERARNNGLGQGGTPR